MASVILDEVYVDIPIFDARNRSLKSNVIAAATGGQIRPGARNRTVIRAVDGVTLNLQHGARVGLVGHNGSGKSTILRVIAGIYEPSAGRRAVDGKIASMLDISFGMDPDSNGWENIMLRGMLLGFSKKDIRARSEAIAAMSGLGDFINLPMRTYSAGMATRLAFAISTSVTPEILLIDEGIGAGDAAFVMQAKERLNRFIGEAGLLVMASHADDLLREWCESGVWMEHGRVRMIGPIDEILLAYQGSIVPRR